jgi:hypothetical protein
MAALQDKQLLEEADKLRLDVTPSPGERLQDVVQKLYATPKAIVDRAKEAIKP